MSSKYFATQLRNSWDILVTLELGQTFSVPTSLKVDEKFRDAALDKDVRYSELFLIGLQNRHYNIILNDYSYFQFSENNGNYRFAFLPNPFFLATNTEFIQITSAYAHGAINLEEYYIGLSELNTEVAVPPIRYEYAPDQYREISHPTSHFHIGVVGDNRWPIAKKLNPLSFVSLMAKNYFSDAWERHSDELNYYLNPLNSTLAAARKDCQNLPESEFSKKETDLFHFS